MGVEPDPWQDWLLDRLLELNPRDGLLRFRYALLGVARQNGKSETAYMIVAWLLATGRARLIVGTAQDLSIARKQWSRVATLFEETPDLSVLLDGAPRRANGQECLRLLNGCEYIIKTSNADAMRSLSVDLLVMDELRCHRDMEFWAAATKTTSARPGSMILAMSNAGDDRSVALNSLRAGALAGTDPATGIWEWSAPEGCDLDDREAWAMANPSLGRGRLSEASLVSALALDPPAIFRVECLNQRVEALDSAIDPVAWRDSADPSATLVGRSRLAVCLDVAPDGAHATLTVAGVEGDGRVRVEVAAAWRSTDAARVELEGLLDRIGADVEVWFPSGPAAVFVPIMAKRKSALKLTGSDVAAACMGFADLARAGRILHPADPLLDAQVGGAAKLHGGDGWRFTRRGLGHADAVYSAAGAVHGALTLPAAKPAWDGPLII